MPTGQSFCRHLAAAESAAGSAARATCWLLVEQAGSWGKKAATESDLDPVLGARLDALATSAGGRFGLIRKPGQRAHHAGDARTVVIAGNLADEAWLVRGEVATAEVLTSLSAAMLNASRPTDLLAKLPQLHETRSPIALVCTNGKRDVCCAIAGRPVANQAAKLAAGQVFETSHTGGHRFAPTGVLLPSGLTFSRLQASELVAALQAAGQGEVHPVLCDKHTNRGLCCLQPWEQAALVAIQTTFPPPVPLSGWEVSSHPAGSDWIVHIAMGKRRDRLRMRRTQLADISRPASCGAQAKPVMIWEPIADNASTKQS